MVLVWVAAFGSFMTSYARARAESLIPSCTVGFLERPERIVLIILGALLNRMAAVLWIIAVLSNVTALQRIVYTLRRAEAGLDSGPPRGERSQDTDRSAPRPPRPAAARAGGLPVSSTCGARCRWRPAPACACCGSTTRAARCAARRLAHAQPVRLDLLRRPGHGRRDVHRRAGGWCCARRPRSRSILSRGAGRATASGCRARRSTRSTTWRACAPSSSARGQQREPQTYTGRVGHQRGRRGRVRVRHHVVVQAPPLAAAGFVLAGGHSRGAQGARQGAAALGIWRDVLDHALERLRRVCAEVAILSGPEPRYGRHRGVPVQPDAVPGECGRWAGLVTVAR